MLFQWPPALTATAVFTYIYYDAVGNPLTQTTLTNTTIFTYDPANRLVNVNGQAYTWDANGNLLNDGTASYAYDAALQLVKVEQHDGTAYQLVSEMVYDGLGQRRQVTAWAGGVCERHVRRLDRRSRRYGACGVAMIQPTVVAATFSLCALPITVQRAGNGTRSVTNLPIGMHYGNICSSAFNYGPWPPRHFR